MTGHYFTTSASKYWRYLEFQLTLEIFQIHEIGKQLPFNFSKEIGSICTSWLIISDVNQFHQMSSNGSTQDASVINLETTALFFGFHKYRQYPDISFDSATS